MFRIILSSIIIIVVSCRGFWDLEISPVSLLTVPILGAHVSVWEDAKRKGRYFATPLVYLREDTAESFMNKFTHEAEMRFEVLMWSLEAHEAVLNHIKSDWNPYVTKNDINLMYMEKIRLVWNSKERQIGNDYTLDSSWKSNSHVPQSVAFRVVCVNLTTCVELETAMKGHPQFFDGLELEYVMNGQQSSRRHVTVTGENLLQGNLISKLISLPPATTQDRYVKVEDMKTIIAETTRNVMASVETDTDYIDTGDEVSLNDILRREFEINKVLTDKFESHVWDSVYWNPEWTRPDKLTHYLNKVLTKDAKDNTVLILNETEQVAHAKGGGVVSLFGFKIGGSGGTTTSSKRKIRIEEVERILKTGNHEVEWTGEIFRMKTFSLYRLNLSKLTSSTQIITANVQVKRSESIRRIKLRVTEFGPQTMMITPKLVEDRLNAKLKQVNDALVAAKLQLKETVDAVKTNKERINRTEATMTQMGESRGPGGTTYIRWGRTTCPSTNTELVYHGYAGGRYYNHKGGGSNLVCLSREPEFNITTSGDEGTAYIYGAEYAVPKLFLSNVNNPGTGNNALHIKEVPCAVCRTKTRPSKVMIPGRKTCEGDGWTREYWGYLMTGHKDYAASMNYVCVDYAPEQVMPDKGGIGAFLYIVQAKCYALKCPPYDDNYEITCVVCTK